MRKVFSIVLVAVMAMFYADMAAAQGVRAPAYNRVKVRPNQPKLIIIPPSAAIKRAMRMNPGAKALGVRKKGSIYIVKLKQGGRIIQQNVNAASGAGLP